ncbi:hypothetical protein ZIOFF_029614 [Zingiber officinale]|uniref:BTB domain-containing protein n=1 Tax=Zingiber officinale TaxID=94328 RepID=A0A8J5GWY8_ZINOF|nr:hypothetical protein ZIOFF_029614 [Zingiber officinale]
MRGWQGLGVVDTIYEEEEEEDEDEDEDDESFNSLSFTPCASLSLTPSPDPSLERSVKEWTQATGVKPDVVVQVNGDLFHLHREPLVSHSGYFERHLAASSAVAVSPPSSMTAETFAGVAGFCYGCRVALSQTNLAAVWVAAEWLQMGGNDTGLVAQAESYFHREVVTSGEDPAATVLRSCAAFQLSPEAEAAAAAEVAASCVEALAASGGGGDGRWTEDLAALSVEQFRRLAAAIRGHDGELTEEEKVRICSNINCMNLSPGVLVHLVQNPCLPVRFVVQAMLVEQLHTRRLILDRAAVACLGDRGAGEDDDIGDAVERVQPPPTLGAILQRDAARRHASQIRAAAEATSLRIESLERDLSGLRQRLRWSEEKRADMESVRSSSFRIVRGAEADEELVLTAGKGSAPRSGGLGRRLMRGLRQLFQKTPEAGGQESSARSAGRDVEVAGKVRRGHRRNNSFS